MYNITFTIAQTPGLSSWRRRTRAAASAPRGQRDIPACCPLFIPNSALALGATPHIRPLHSPRPRPLCRCPHRSSFPTSPQSCSHCFHRSCRRSHTSRAPLQPLPSCSAQPPRSHAAGGLGDDVVIAQGGEEVRVGVAGDGALEQLSSQRVLGAGEALGAHLCMVGGGSRRAVEEGVVTCGKFRRSCYLRSIMFAMASISATSRGWL